MNLEDLSELYDALFYITDLLFKIYDPCQIKVNKAILDEKGFHPAECANTRKAYPNCCWLPCKHLGPQGCKVECLACRLYLCDTRAKTCPAFGIILQKLSKIAQDYSLYHVHRSKDELGVFKELSPDSKGSGTK